MTTKPKTHMRPPSAFASRSAYWTSRAYCGRAAAKLTDDRSFVTCTDCQAAHDADQENTR